eukprot:383463-Amphidinium_carterae.2
MDYETHHRNSNYIRHQHSNNLVYNNYAQTNAGRQDQGIPTTTGITTTAEARDEARMRTAISLSGKTNRVLQRPHSAQHDEGLLQLTTLFVQSGHLLLLENILTVLNTLPTELLRATYYGCVHYDPTFNTQQKNAPEQYRNQINTTSKTQNIYCDTYMEQETTNYTSSQNNQQTTIRVTIATSSKTQQTIAQSSAEAEL